MTKKKNNISPIEASARDFTNVRDIKGSMLYTRDDYIFTYLRVHPYNMDLLSVEEKRVRTQKLAVSFDGDRGDFTYFTFPRELDLDEYKKYLKERHQDELQSLGRRQIIVNMIKEAMDLSTSGENFEHQHFLKIWKKAESNISDSSHELALRAEEFQERYNMVGITTSILMEADIIKLCNLFGNSSQATYEMANVNTLYSPIPQIR